MKDIRYILTSGRLLVELPSKMKFDFEFLHAMNEFLEIASVRSIKRVCVTCDADAEYDNMCIVTIQPAESLRVFAH